MKPANYLASEPATDPLLSSQITVRLSDLDSARVESVARQLGWSQGQVVRKLVLDGLGDLERKALEARELLGQ